MNLKPTQREVKVILQSRNIALPRTCFNDKRSDGGRIKMWDTKCSLGDMQYLEQFLTILFPSLDIEVYTWKNSCTCIKWSQI